MGPSGRIDSQVKRRNSLKAKVSSKSDGAIAPAAQLPQETSSGAVPVQVAIFATPLGWMGLAGQGPCVSRLTIGHSSAQDARAELSRHFDSSVEADWNKDVRQLLERYAVGQQVDFSKVAIDVTATTEFRRAVIRATRAIQHGETISYGELAARAGRPGAARAVGTAMSSNRIPIIIPCHRVLASNGLGGYSAAQGLDLKKRLLEMEGAIR